MHGVSVEQIKQAEWVAGVELTDDERTAVAKATRLRREEIAYLRDRPLENDVPMAVTFEPELDRQITAKRDQKFLLT